MGGNHPFKRNDEAGDDWKLFYKKADLKLTPKKVVMHGSRRQLVQGCDNCSAYVQSLYQAARLCRKLTFPVLLCF